jgi:hypothetical protein
MTTPRRRVLRPSSTTSADPRRIKRLERCREQLVKSRTALGRWMSRLRRSFRAVEKEQRRIGRLERHVAQLEQT